MSLLKTIKAQLGLSNTPANNFTITAEADNGTLKLARGNAGATTQDILTVDAAGNINAPVSIQKAGSVLQALSDFSGTNVSLTTNGYQKLPSGLIIQWGNSTTATAQCNYPIAFTSVVLSINATVYGASPAAMNAILVQNTSLTHFNAFNATGVVGYFFIAIGK